MRRLIVLLAVVGCAQLGAPPGGPEDRNAPVLLRISPDTNAVNARPREVELRFDEVLNERPARGGELSNLFLVSPRRGRIEVDWKRTRIEIRPRRGGWLPNTTYTITQLAGVSDLRGNTDSVEHKYTFSTGAAPAPSFISGQVFDWVAARHVPKAYVEAIRLPDSLTYSEYADSLGRFVIRHVPPGRYHLVAVVDANSNRVLDRREVYDSATVTLTDSVRRELLAFVHDSIGPGISQVEVRDSTTIRVGFDRPLHPRDTVTAARFTVKAADSSVVPITQLLLGRAFEQAERDSARARVVRDSIERARVADSIRQANPQPPAPPRAAAPPLRPAPGAARDTTTPPRPSRPPPETYAILRLGRPLAVATSYRVRADSLRSLLGIARSSERVFTTERTRPAADSLRPPPDSANRGAPPVRRPPRDR